MDRTTTELAAIEEAVLKATEAQICELNELQLVLVGGGYGDTVI
jgi:hypothetical protein